MKKKHRVRHPLKERLSAVKAVLEKGNSKLSVASQYSIDPKDLRCWVAMYEKHGSSGLVAERRKYSSQEKLHVLKTMVSHNLSLIETAVHFKIPLGSIKSWKKRYKMYGITGFDNNRSMKKENELDIDPASISSEEIKKLLIENQRLRAENAYLKKLEALVQARKNSERTRK